jgi:hypothetical protein
MKKKMTELKGDIDISIIIFASFNTNLSIIVKTNHTNISEDTEYLNNTINPLDLIDTYGTQNLTSVAFSPHVHTQLLYLDQP